MMVKCPSCGSSKIHMCIHRGSLREWPTKEESDRFAEYRRKLEDYKKSKWRHFKTPPDLPEGNSNNPITAQLNLNGPAICENCNTWFKKSNVVVTGEENESE